MFGSQDMLNHFRDELRSAGLHPDEIIPDGTLQRCPVEGKPQAKDGAYLLHLDEPVAGWWQNHRTGTEGTWTAGGNGRKPTEQQRQAWEAARQRREIEQAHAHAEAAERAKKMLAEAVECADHPYLQRKGVRPCLGLKVDRDDRLLVPVLGPDSKVQSLQAIAPNGKKRFMNGGRIAGGFFPIAYSGASRPPNPDQGGH
ncbi:MAG: hypothetical protein KKE29_00765 [Proteobacteria bacterium]|nr:hypothetical protein [Pseudomonadota bacterium]MBU4597184.1 hypothetical protein [Pseudomonadota bacterium]